MRSLRASLLGLLAALLLPTACANDTGLIVEVSRNTATTPAAIGELDFVVGVVTGAQPTALTPYQRDDASSVTIPMDAGRDLAITPYQLLLRDGQPTGAPSQIVVAVIGRQGDQIVAFGAFDQPQTFVSGKIVLRSIELSGDQAPTVTATGCVTWNDTAGEVRIASPTDKDCDGVVVGVDCDDTNGDVFPGHGEVCGNGLDDDCNGMIDEEKDADGDQVTNCGGDCDDANALTFPGAPEVCDGKDNDCNDRCDDGELDVDDDHFNTCGEKIKDDGVCEDIGVPDCNDGDPTVHPFASETCNGVDDDCNGMCDDGDGMDVDMDGFTVCGSAVGNATPGGAGRCGPLVQALRDCDDGDGEVHPFADEICDGKDDNCDGAGLEQSPCYVSDPVVTDECRAGARPCDDDASDGTSGYGACVQGADALIPPEFCGAYASCDAMGASDPWACANSMLAMEKYGCQLFVVGANLCPARALPLAGDPTATTCSWGIFGGMTQAHYLVGLESGAGMSPGPTADVCDVLFDVISKVDLVPQEQQVFVGYQDDVSTFGKLVEINLLPTPVATCPMTGGIHCNLLP